MPLFLSGLGMSSYFLALCYFLSSFLTLSKFRKLNLFLSSKGLRWSIIQLLVLSIALGSIFRCMSFSTLCILDFQQASRTAAARSDSKWKFSESATDLSFYNKVVAVLFNMPDYLFVSSYVLLLIVWAESFQSSRRHWFSAEQFRRRWMIFYLCFNVCLYSVQLVLYGLLFLYDDQDIFVDPAGTELHVIPALIFYVVAMADLLVPLIIACTWIVLTLTLSGFPFKSVATKTRLSRVSRVAMVWSLARIAYSIMIFLTFTRGWFSVKTRPNEENPSVTSQSMVLSAVFLTTELVPIYLVLDAQVLTMEQVEPLLARDCSPDTSLSFSQSKNNDDDDEQARHEDLHNTSHRSALRL